MLSAVMHFILDGDELMSNRNLDDVIQCVYDVLSECAQYLENGAPICKGSDLHTEILLCRDKLNREFSCGSCERGSSI